MKNKLKAMAFAVLLAIFTLTMCFPAALAADDEAYFTERDLSGDWDADEAVTIELTGDGAVCSSAAVRVDGSTVTITEAGVYVLSGALSDGTVIVDADDQKVQLVLSGASITSTTTAAIRVEEADKVFITLAEGTQNALINTTGFDDNDAVVFARDDIVFNGSGELTIESAKDGIEGKDDVKFTGGTYTITAENRGIDANDSVRIADGSFTIVSGRDYIRVNNDEESDKGYVVITGGAFDLTAGGGAENGEAHAEGMMGFGQAAASADEGSSVSTKGVKASGTLTITGGDFAIDTADDALHAGGDIAVEGGALSIASGDDGVHSDAALTISGGAIDISRSYEGLEGMSIAVSGGDIRLNADDDGLNAAGGSDGSGYGFYDMFASQEGVTIDISGGTLYVNAEGDGIDSNGSLSVSGGTIVVSGPTDSGNGAMDYNGSATITGGTLIAAGSAAMAQNFGSGSTQVCALVQVDGAAGTITLKDADGNVLITAEVEKQFSSVLISSPELEVGQTYSLETASGSAEVAVTDTITGAGSGMGMMGGRGMMGDQGGQFAGQFGGQNGMGGAFGGRGMTGDQGGQPGFGGRGMMGGMEFGQMPNDAGQASGAADGN